MPIGVEETSLANIMDMLQEDIFLILQTFAPCSVWQAHDVPKDGSLLTLASAYDHWMPCIKRIQYEVY